MFGSLPYSQANPLVHVSFILKANTLRGIFLPGQLALFLSNCLEVRLNVRGRIFKQKKLIKKDSVFLLLPS